MDFLNVGPWEIVVILIIAILVAGPERMVEIARSLGRLSSQLRNLSREFTAALQTEIRAAEQEASTELDDVKRDLEDVLAGAPQGESEAEEE